MNPHASNSAESVFESRFLANEKALLDQMAERALRDLKKDCRHLGSLGAVLIGRQTIQERWNCSKKG
jgi:hypothetical protein